jgi:hypothetical protein
MTQRRGFLGLTGRTLLAAVLVAAFPGGAALAATSGEQTAAFFRAVQTDDASTVKSMLAKGFDPNRQNPVGGEPALVLALREGSMRVFQVLLDQPGIQLEAPAANGNTALMMAAFKRNRPAAEALVARGRQPSRLDAAALCGRKRRRRYRAPAHQARREGRRAVAAGQRRLHPADDGGARRPSGYGFFPDLAGREPETHQHRGPERRPARRTGHGRALDARST